MTSTPPSSTPTERPLDALARTLHSTAPHGQLYPFNECPQRHRDEQEAQEIADGLSVRGVGLVVVSLSHIEGSVSEAISE